MYEPIKTGVFGMEKRTNKVGIRLTDEHLKKLNEYCEITAASPSGVINALAESYIQAMIDGETFISPNVKNLQCNELLLAADPTEEYKTKKEQRRAG